jgi:cyclophilin family peptidyl-prolyl cis-trans isomerase
MIRFFKASLSCVSWTGSVGLRTLVTALCLLSLLHLPLTVLAQAGAETAAKPKPFALPFTLPERSKVLALRSAKIDTSRGPIYLELFPEQAPWHVANFKQLADRGYYAGLTFHLYKPGFLIQGGAPRGDPLGGPGYSLPAEFSQEKQVRGTLGMGRVMDQLNPERRSHGSQFYILTGNGSNLTGKYTSFGRVAKGMDVVDRLREGDVIRNVTVYVRR